MHLWHSLSISTCWWWEGTSARGREKKVLKEQLLFWRKKKTSKVVHLKIQIQWIQFCGKLENWDWTLRRDTPEILRMQLVQNCIRERKRATWRQYPKRWTSWAKSLRARFWAVNTWGNRTTSRLWQQGSVEFGEKKKHNAAQERFWAQIKKRHSEKVQRP